MGAHRANESYTCNSKNGCTVTPGNGTGTAVFTFTPKPGVAGGADLVLTASDNSTPIDFAVYTTGTDIAIRGGSAPDFYVNVMITDGAVRGSTVPALDDTNAGRNLYAVEGGVARFVGTLRVDNLVTDNGAGDRIRLDRGTNSVQDIQDINDLLAAGEEVYLAISGDNGLSTSFAPAAPPATVATTFSLHGAGIAFIAEGDTISSVTTYSTSSTLI